MDLAKTLVRSVVRSFYETKHILIIDALVIHSALPDDDLAYLISMNIKDLHKMCQKLKEDRLLASHARSEIREGQQRPNSRTYYYIDYRQTIDAIKWRVYRIDKDLQGPVVPPSEKKEYFCDTCGSQWTQMEVLDSVSANGFLCHRCHSVLRHGDSGQAGGHEKSTRMNNQFKFITDLLPKIDSVVIPDNNFETAFNNKRPVIRDATHQTAVRIGVDAMNRPTAVRGLANTGPSTLSVSIQAGNGPTEEELAAERAQRERVAQQNALPSWMSNSTVTGEAFKTDLAPGGGSLGGGGSNGGVSGGDGAGKNGVKHSTVKAAADPNAEAAIDDYFSRLKKQAAEEAQKKMAAADEDDEDDEDEDEDEEFVDVMQTATNSAVGTPAASTPGLAPPAPSRGGGSSNNNSNGHTNGYGSSNGHSNLPLAPSPLRNQSTLKREAMSDPPSPTMDASFGSGISAAGRQIKKVKLEGDGDGDALGGSMAPKAAADEESDEDEDIEFEDV